MTRSLALLLIAPLAVTLSACCGSFTLDEPTAQGLSALGANPEALEVEYDCGLAGGVVPQLDRACLLLGDEAAHVLDLQARCDKALTDGEKVSLGELRDQALARLQAHVAQLQAAIEHLQQPRADNRLAVLLSMDEISVIRESGAVADASQIDSDAMAALRKSSINAGFGEVRVVSRDQRPLGVLLRQVSPAQALGMLVDAMRNQAVEEGYLRPQTQAALE